MRSSDREASNDDELQLGVPKMFSLRTNEGEVVEVGVVVKAKGPRSEEIEIGDDEYIQIDYDEENPVVHFDSIKVEDGGRIRFFPEVDPSDKRKLLFTQIRADEVEFEDGSGILIRLPDGFEPEFEDQIKTVTIVSNKLAESDEGIRILYADNAFTRDEDNHFDVQGENVIQLVSLSSQDQFTIESELNFFDARVERSQSGCAGSECDTDEDPVVPPPSDPITDNLVVIVAAAGGGLVVCCVLVIVVCYVRKARKDAYNYRAPEAGSLPLQSARDFATDADDGYMSAQHDPLFNGGSIDHAPRTSHAGDMYDRVPDEAPSMSNTEYSAPSTVALPPKISDFDQSVYAAVPQALRTESDPWELNFNDLQLGRKLGEGAYGTGKRWFHRNRLFYVFVLFLFLLFWIECYFGLNVLL